MTVGASQAGAELILARLAHRLSLTAEALFSGPAATASVTDLPDHPPATDPADYIADTLPALIRACPARPGPAHWLLLTMVTTVFPTASEVQEFARRVELDDANDVLVALLDRVIHMPRPSQPEVPTRLVRDVVVDVDFCARDDKHTGIQRVVRETLPRWSRGRSVVPVRRTDQHNGYRSLTQSERARVLEYAGRTTASRPAAPDSQFELIVPWQTVLVLPEVPDPLSVERLSGLAQYSGNQVAAIGYDMIPIISTELRPLPEAGAFARYLALVKHVDRVAGISASATAEFAGFSDMMGGQGLPGPLVAEIPLPEQSPMVAEHPAETAQQGTSGNRPEIVLAARREPHKNLRAVLHAAERLWVEGLDFGVTMIGGQGWDERDLTRTIERLKAQGRALTTMGWVDDEQLTGHLQRAAFSVFVSLHEGYGLPVAESLACGTPVVTTDFGSQREIGELGGCLLVDPRDDRSVTDAMRRMLTEPGLLEQLRAQIARRPQRTWEDYATDAWAFLVEGQVP